MHLDFDEVIPRRDNLSAKWNAYPEDVLPLWVADMDFRSPQAVRDALQRAVEHAIHGYPPWLAEAPEKLTPMKATLLERLERLYAWKVQPEDIFFLPGVVVGFNLACQALAETSGKILVQPPVYPPCLKAAELAGMARVDAELHPESPAPDAASLLRYEIDWQVFNSAFEGNVRAFLLCNPHNPSGKVFTRIELEHLAEACLRKNAVIISDEIHGDLVYPPNHHIPIASLDPIIAQRTITIMAPSKTFNIPGLQFAFAVVPNAAMRQQLHRAARGLHEWVNNLGYTAAEAAYREGQEWLDQVLVYLEANRAFATDFVLREMPGVKLTVPEGTYLTWLDCRDLGLDDSPYQHFLKHARVALTDGARFGPGGAGFVRLNFACRRALLNEALHRMASSLPR